MKFALSRIGYYVAKISPSATLLIDLNSSPTYQYGRGRATTIPSLQSKSRRLAATDVRMVMRNVLK